MLIMWLRVCVFATCAAMALGCGFPGAPAHSSVTFSTDSIRTGTVATYSCDRGFELLGPSRKECTAQNSTWQPPGIPFCVINVAAGKAPMQSSTAQGGVPQKAVDGSTSGFFSPDTCTLTEQEVNPYWYVNLLEPYMVQLVRLDFGRPCCDDNQPATVVVRVGNNRPDLKINPICNRFTGYLEEGRPLFLPCNPPMPGAFVSVHIESPPGQMLSICEAFVYTDQALPIERCPQFRDQPPGSTATYNGKCYTFYNQGALDFAAAQDFCQQRQGSLITETNPALQGFLSWELWRRHRDDPTGQYWMGAVRDPQDATSWTWIDGQPVGVSFWSLPGGSEDCARFDGTKDWLWSDTDCRQQLYYICQHQPLTCGRPEQPPNSTLVASGGFEVDSEVQYRCQDGHLLVGPEQRTCLDTGFYSGYAPTCKNLQCGAPANIDGGSYSLVNGSRGYMAMVEYTCDDSYVIVGRHQLICDVDERWNGPPPHCEPSSCDDPPQVLNGQYRLSTNSTVVGTVVEYFCIDDKFELVGPPTLRCLRNGTYDADAPICREFTSSDAARTSLTTNRLRFRAPTSFPSSLEPALPDILDQVALATSRVSTDSVFSQRRDPPAEVTATGFDFDRLTASTVPQNDPPASFSKNPPSSRFSKRPPSSPFPDRTVTEVQRPFGVRPGDRVVFRGTDGSKPVKVVVLRRRGSSQTPDVTTQEPVSSPPVTQTSPERTRLQKLRRRPGVYTRRRPSVTSDEVDDGDDVTAAIPESSRRPSRRRPLRRRLPSRTGGTRPASPPASDDDAAADDGSTWPMNFESVRTDAAGLWETSTTVSMTPLTSPSTRAPLYRRPVDLRPVVPESAAEQDTTGSRGQTLRRYRGRRPVTTHTRTTSSSEAEHVETSVTRGQSTFSSTHLNSASSSHRRPRPTKSSDFSIGNDIFSDSTLPHYDASLDLLHQSTVEEMLTSRPPVPTAPTRASTTAPASATTGQTTYRLERPTVTSSGRLTYFRRIPKPTPDPALEEDASGTVLSSVHANPQPSIVPTLVSRTTLTSSRNPSTKIRRITTKTTMESLDTFPATVSHIPSRPSKQPAPDTDPTTPTMSVSTNTTRATASAADAGAGAEVEADDDVGENAYGRPEENEIPDTVNIRQNSPPGISVPDNTLGVRVNGSRLNIGGIIALGVFGGFVFLAAVITSVIIIAKRNSEGVGHSQERRIADGAGRSSGYSTESEVNGLNKYYKRAWDNLQASGRHQGGRKPSPRRHRHHTCRSGDEDSELGYRPSGDDGKRRHHHHHHHRSRNHRSQERGKAAR